MRIECPACGTAYEVPDQTVAGRKVQCAKCGVKWAPIPAIPPPNLAPPTPALELEQALAPPLPDPGFVASSPPPDARPAPPASTRSPRPWGLLAAWAGSLLLLAAVVALAVVERSRVMEAWPPSIRLYTMLGLH